MLRMRVPRRALRRSRAAEARPVSPAEARATRLAVAGIAAYCCAQALFLAVGCDWDLCGDEAEFWAWSRKLDWSYFARGPLIAVVIRLGTELFGSASLALTGSMMPAVRLPAVLLAALTAWGVFRLASEACRSRRVGLLAVAILPAVPSFRLGGLIMTCDTPLIACWTWAAVYSHRAIHRGRGASAAWLLAGSWTALGVLAKYTMLALPASVGLALLLDPARRRLLLRPGFWSLAAGGLVGMAPVVYWNACHDWVAMVQLADRIGVVSDRGGLHVGPLLTFLAGDAATMLAWFPLGVLALGRALSWIVADARPRLDFGPGVRLDRPDRPDLLFLVCLWGVLWSTCAAVSLRGETEMNWSAPGQVALVVLIAWMLRGWFAVPGASRRVAGFAAFWLASMLALSAIQHTEWFYPAIARWAPGPTAEQPAPMRWLDPTGRMRAQHEAIPAVEAALASLRAEGLDPFVLAPTYATASLVSFYLPGQPEVYCLSWSPGYAARVVNQHDLWHPNPRHDLDAFRDRPAVVVEDAGRPPGFARGVTKGGVFDRVGETTRVVARRSGLVVGAWDVTVCRGYRGPRNVELIRNYLKRYASNAYFQAQGGTVEGYVRGLFRDVLHQSPTPTDVAFWSRLLETQTCELLVVEFLKIRGIAPDGGP